MATQTQDFFAGPDDDGRRLDRLVRRLFPDLSLSAVYRLIREGSVRLNGRKAKQDQRVHNGDRLEIRCRELPSFSGHARQVTMEPSMRQDFENLFLAETEDLVIVNKPRGMLTHGPDGLDELVRRYYADRAANSLAFTPAPLHRLDRNTSGALAVSKSLKGARDFSQALREGRIGKEYLAVLDGSMGSSELWTDLLVRDGDGKVTAPCDLAPRVQDGVHAGREARSLAVPLARAHGKTLALIRLYTGLTHQIRAQAAARGYPLAGDNKIGRASCRERG